MFGCAVILTKYGMDGKRDTRSVESNSLKDHDVRLGDAFDDPRLDKLWNKVRTCAASCLWGSADGRPACVSHRPPSSVQQAKSSGKFSSEELSNLKKEFQHHKDKIHEYNILVDAVSRTEGEAVLGNASGPSLARVRLRLSGRAESGRTACPTRRRQRNKQHLPASSSAPTGPLSLGAVDCRMTHSCCVAQKDVLADIAHLLELLLSFLFILLCLSEALKC